MEVDFVTGNKKKVMEANSIGKDFGIIFKQIDYTYPEIRDDNPVVVAEHKARTSYDKYKKPLIVEDSGVFIHALNGFPGTCSAFVFEKIGLKGVLKLLEDVDDRSASMITAIAFFDGKEMRTFVGEVEGFISHEVRGDWGFGYDPFFVPEGREKTFAEEPEYKSDFSHRIRAFKRFCKWYKEEYSLL